MVNPAVLLSLALVACFVGFILWRKKEKYAEPPASAPSSMFPEWGETTLMEDVYEVPSYGPYVQYLQSHEDQAPTGQGRKLILEPFNRDLIAATVKAIRSRITYTPDQRRDYGDTKPGEGDCEDYALAYRKALLALGYPRDALHIVHCEFPDGTWHAVLGIDTEAGTYLADNSSDHPFSWNNAKRAGWKSWVREGTTISGNWNLVV